MQVPPKIRERAFTIRGGKAAIETARTTILILF
jgi:hypothetical protein